MNNKDLISVYGGLSITSSLINAVVKTFTTVYDFGKRFATGLLRSRNNKYCALD